MDYKLEQMDLEKKLEESEIKKTSITIKKKIFINDYTEYQYDNFLKNLGKYTFGLDKVIPWENGGFVFSGGLLHNIIKDNFNLELTDIDLFFYGSIESKKNTLNDILNNLDMNQYNYLFGYVGSVIYIFVQGIPRIIQLIMTDKSGPEEIIDGFDLIHLQFYSDGNKIFATQKTIELLKTGSIEFTGTHKVKHRLIKHFEKGNDGLKEIIYSTDAFILNSSCVAKLLFEKKQKKLYKTTYNLTIYSDLTPINFNKFDRTKIELKDYFDKCKIFYTKPDNKDLSEVNMVGKFINYFHIKDKYSQKSVFCNKLNWEDDDNFIELDKNNLEYEYKSIQCAKPNSILMGSYDYHSFYLPCKFIRHENYYFENDNGEIKNGKKMYFKLQDKILIKKILSNINYENFKSKIDFKLKQKNIKKKFLNRFDETEQDNIHKIQSPFENTLDFPDINQNSTANEFIKDDGLVIKSNIYNVEWFEITNGFNIFNELNNEQEIYCAFRYFVYVDLNYEEETLNLIDMNLQPIYIYTKK